MCIAMRYAASMIRSFRHKGIQRFFETGSTAESRLHTHRDWRGNFGS